MILQNIVFPKQGVCTETGLYYRKRGISFTDYSSCTYINDKLVLRMNECVSFTTYYNSFSLLKWIKYTNLKNVTLNLVLKGRFVVNLIYMTISSPGNNVEFKSLGRQQIYADEKKEFSFPLYTGSEDTDGSLAFSIEALTDNCIVYGGTYSTDIDDCFVRDIKIGIGICTFKRESYIKRNMTLLGDSFFYNPLSSLQDKLEVFIADNAKTLNPDEYDSRHIHIYMNKNAGGSGGFARAMIEVNNANERGAGFTHILLMDDDVVFDPESIFRTYSILSLLKSEYADAFVGGAMFYQHQPYMQYTSGEYWHGKTGNEDISMHIAKRHFRKDMRQIQNICLNEMPSDYSNYQGWWYCAIPMTICRKDNLALPLFIKTDDIEYGVRNLKDLILLNGINIWHASFESKYSPSNEYYAVRNYLVVTSIHKIGLTTDYIKLFVKKYFISYVVNFKYLEAELFFDAVDDFLGGVDHFKAIDPETKNSQVMKQSYNIIDSKDLPVPFSKEMFDKTLAIRETKSKFKRFFRKATLNGLLLPSRKVVAVGMWGGSSIQTFRAKYIVRYEPSNGKAFVLRRSLKRFISLYRRYKKTMKKVSRLFINVRDEFETRAKELESIEFWADKLNLD